MGRYVITDLTELKLPDMCLGVIDIDSGQCLRPRWPRITSHWIEDNDARPGVLLEGQITLPSSIKFPHIEDASHENLTNLGPLPSKEFKEILDKSASNSISDGLEVDVPKGFRGVSVTQNPKRSLISLKVNPENFSVEYDSEYQKFRASFVDCDGHPHIDFPIGDSRFERVYTSRDSGALEELNHFVSSQEEIYLRIGLTRAYAGKGNLAGEKYGWLQVNGIYVFPDLRTNWMTNSVYTVGHSTHTKEKFLSLLRTNNVTAVADVRSVPYSKFTPQFNTDELASFLDQHDIKYVHLGKELGARSENPDCYTPDGKVDYTKLAGTKLFQSGLERVRKGSEKYQIALMCAEKKPDECHRTILVAKELEKLGFDLYHILDDGTKEPHSRTKQRLNPTEKQPDLLLSKGEQEEQAMRIQEKRIAFRK